MSENLNFGENVCAKEEFLEDLAFFSFFFGGMRKLLGVYIDLWGQTF